MRAGNSLQSVGYEVAGGVKDWMLKGDIGTGTKGIVLGFTGEGGAGGGTGGTYGSFWPPASEIINLCKGMVFQNLQMAFAAGSYVEITDRSDIAVSSVNGSFNFRLKRIGLENGPVTVTLLPLENMTDAGAPVTINSLTNYFDLYNGSIGYSLPTAIQPGYRIRFAWQVQTGGQTYYDTVVKFYNPVQLFSDDMEGTIGSSAWLVSANWNYSNGIAFAGSKSLTESPVGLYAANRNDNIQYNGTFDLSNATAAFLTFWVRHRAENFRDKLQVQFSSNGTLWVPVAGHTTVQEQGTVDGNTLNGEPALTGIREDWIPEMYDLTPFLGQAAVRMRLVFTSDANTTGYDFEVDEEFSIDNLKVIKSTPTLVVLPVRFLSLAGQHKPNNTIELNWEAVTDAEHEYFVIERSADGGSFTNIGTHATQPYRFIDNQPLTGFNYYRIKSVDRNGRYDYSKIIHLVYKPEWVINVYPNPVVDELNIHFKTGGVENITVLVTDVSGQTVYSKEIHTGVVNDIEVNSAAWPAGVYMLKVLNNRKETLVVRQLVRQ